MHGEGFRAWKLKEHKEKCREKEKKKKAKPRCRRIEPWIVSYILSLASLVPCATVS